MERAPMNEPTKLPLTRAQKRLLRLVYVLGGVLAAMMVFVMATIIYRLVHLH
jgi:hypothetical protein